MLREILTSIKEMILDYVKHRLFPVTVVVIVLFAILIRRLFVLQIIEGEEHMENFIYKSEKTLTIEGVRGNIYDRNGKLIAYNELSYSVVYSNDTGISAKAGALGVSENELKNSILSRTIQILEEHGDSLYVDFPIALTGTDGYKYTVRDSQLKNFLKDVYSVTDFDLLDDEKKNATADDVMAYLTSDKMFNLSDTYSKEEALKIVSCRYKLWLNRYQQYMPVTIAYDISEESNAAITEYSDELLGMDVTVKSLRKYNDAEYYAHIIGYIGAIGSEELQEYNENLPDEEKYTGEEMVGKTGIEQYCESELRGKSGSETMYVDNLGKVIETVETTPASAGNDVYLTIDTDLQKYCYDTLEKEIASILLAHITPQLTVEAGENADIPISDVYFGLFNNNYLSIEEMAEPDATELEQSIYSEFTVKKETTLNRLNTILTVDYTPLCDLSTEYQDYMEYICEILRDAGVYDGSLIDRESTVYIEYSSNMISLEEYLKYAISVEAIDISAIDAASTYYDNDEIYNLLCEYIINSLTEDTEFDKQVIKNMIKLGEISGYSVVELLYQQGVLNAENDAEYAEFKSGAYDAYEFMLRKIQNLDITPDMLALDPCSGSVVVTDVNTGDVLAMVSYPSYDINYLTNEVDGEYYNKLLEDKTTPLINRATQQKTAPGSTYKVVSAVAGLNEGVIEQYSYLYCGGVFDKITPSPHCWLLGGHGNLDVQHAIQKSCNVFFYRIGYALALDEQGEYNDALGLQQLRKYATMFGFNDLSGVEVPEAEPAISDNDAVRSAIGQGRNSYAPVQIARYITTVANSGTCYNLTLIDKVTDYQNNLVYDNEATVLNQVDVSQNIWDIVHTGMRSVVSANTPSTELINRVGVNIAGKTGTAQESEIRPNHALFVSYAPYENPEVAVTCVIQNGYSSGNARELAGFIYAYLYNPDMLADEEMSGNTMVSD